MKKHLTLLSLLLLALFIISGATCTDSSSNPGDGEVLYDKYVNPSDTSIIVSVENIKLIFPKTAITHPARLIIKTVPKPPSSGMPNYIVGENIYDVEIEGQTNFNVNFTVELTYNPSEMPAGMNPTAAIKGVYYDGSKWAEISTVYDDAANKIVMTTNLLAKFGYLVKTN